MRWNEINETRLPLIKGDTRRLRGSYAAFIITMSPRDFLSLTCAPGDFERISTDQFPKDRETFSTSMGGDDKDFGRFNIPFLTVQWPNGAVLSHEGRHRALMIDRKGGGVFPVAVFLRYPDAYEVTYQKWNVWTEETTEHKEDFDSLQQARARYGELKTWNERSREAWGTPEEEKYDGNLYHQVRMETLYGGTVKGSPNHENPEDPWERKAFTADDMPKQLLGQYDHSVIVNRFKVGVVKGYTHFR